MTPLSLPPGYPRIRSVRSFAALADTPFGAGVNALCWERPLPGGFDEIVARLGPGTGLVALDEARLRTLPVSPAARPAIELLLADLQRLRARGCRSGCRRATRNAATPRPR
jgi:hypothetical protein